MYCVFSSFHPFARPVLESMYAWDDEHDVQTCRADVSQGSEKCGWLGGREGEVGDGVGGQFFMDCLP